MKRESKEKNDKRQGNGERDSDIGWEKRERERREGGQTERASS